jgi:hypothetical protein
MARNSLRFNGMTIQNVDNFKVEGGSSFSFVYGKDAKVTFSPKGSRNPFGLNSKIYSNCEYIYEETTSS